MAGTNSTAVVPNTFNLEDRPQLAIIFFLCLVFSHVYVLSRVLALLALRRQLGLKSTGLKIIISAYPVTFATMLAIRTSTHALNNACAELVPYSYLVRFGIHITLLCYQLRAFLVLKWFKTFGLHPQRRTRCIKLFFALVFTPAAAVVAAMWVLGLGIQLNGVCTVGLEDGSDKLFGISVWVWISQCYEAVFIIANITTELYLNKSRISLSNKLELRTATRWSTVLLVWDCLFRFSVIQSLIGLIAGTDSPAYKPTVTAYAVTFACVYVSGSSCLFAFAFERARLRHFRLGVFRGGPARLFKVLTGRLNFTLEELEGHKQMLAEMKVRNEKLIKGRSRVQTASSLAAHERTATSPRQLSSPGAVSDSTRAAAERYARKKARASAGDGTRPATQRTRSAGGVELAASGRGAVVAVEPRTPPQDVINPLVAGEAAAAAAVAAAEASRRGPGGGSA